jgi:hypothetical protein
VFEAFVDESGTHKGASIVGVAAWAAHRAYWKRFVSWWGDRQFHAKDPKCSALKQGLFDAIQGSHLEGFVAWMKPQDYQAYASHLFKSAIGNAYAVCTFNCALGICKFAQKENLGPVAFVIEGGQPNAEWIREVLEGMKEKPRYGITSVAVVKKHDYVQLYTADFLAHSCTSNQDWFQRFRGTGRVLEDHITPNRMRKMSDDLVKRYKILKRNKELLRARQNNTG